MAYFPVSSSPSLGGYGHDYYARALFVIEGGKDGHACGGKNDWDDLCADCGEDVIEGAEVVCGGIISCLEREKVINAHSLSTLSFRVKPALLHK